MIPVLTAGHPPSQGQVQEDIIEWWCHWLMQEASVEDLQSRAQSLEDAMVTLGELSKGRLFNRIQIAALVHLICSRPTSPDDKESLQNLRPDEWQEVAEQLDFVRNLLLHRDANSCTRPSSNTFDDSVHTGLAALPIFNDEYHAMIVELKMYEIVATFRQTLHKLQDDNSSKNNRQVLLKQVEAAVNDYKAALSKYNIESEALTCFLLPDLYKAQSDELFKLPQRLCADLDHTFSANDIGEHFSYALFRDRFRSLLRRWCGGVLEMPTLVRLGYGGACLVTPHEAGSASVSSWGENMNEEQSIQTEQFPQCTTVLSKKGSSGDETDGYETADEAGVWGTQAAPMKDHEEMEGATEAPATPERVTANDNDAVCATVSPKEIERLLLFSPRGGRPMQNGSERHPDRITQDISQPEQLTQNEPSTQEEYSRNTKTKETRSTSIGDDNEPIPVLLNLHQKSLFAPGARRYAKSLRRPISKEKLSQVPSDLNTQEEPEQGRKGELSTQDYLLNGTSNATTHAAATTNDDDSEPISAVVSPPKKGRLRHSPLRRNTRFQPRPDVEDFSDLFTRAAELDTDELLPLEKDVQKNEVAKEAVATPEKPLSQSDEPRRDRRRRAIPRSDRKSRNSNVKDFPDSDSLPTRKPRSKRKRVSVIQWQTSSDDDDEEYQGPPRRQTFPISARQSRYSISPTKSTTNRYRMSASPNSKSPRNSIESPNGKRRRRFTDQEKDYIRKGVEQFGIGNWSLIRYNSDRVLLSRTNVNIKDCYRTMVKRGEL